MSVAIKPFVIVQMITYNHAAYIKQAIESVMNQQTTFAFCLYIFEDCSQDNTAEICKELAARYPDKIYLHLHPQNIGAIANANSIHAATLESGAAYLAPCEGDDYWTDPRKLQKQIDFLEANKDFNICFHKIKIDEGGIFSTDHITNVPAIVTTQKDLIDNGNYIHTPSVVVRTKNLRFPKWFESAMPADFALYIIATNNGGKIYYMDEVMAHYRIHDGGIWSNGVNKKYTQKIAITLYRCYSLGHNKYKIKESIYGLALSVRLLGYKDITKLEYYRIILKELFHYGFSVKEAFFIWTPFIRKVIKGD